jgi:hypothetical protein
MKTYRIIMILAALAGAAVTASRAQSGGYSPINITVNPVDQVTYGAALPGSMTKPENHSEKLAITLQNLAQWPYTNVTVRYAIFEQDAQNLKIDAVLKHDRPVKLKPSAWLTFTSEVANVTFTPAHNNISNPPAKKGVIAAPTSTPVKAAGKTFAGYAIVIVQTNTVVAEVFNPIDRTNLSVAVFGKLSGKP